MLCCKIMTTGVTKIHDKSYKATMLKGLSCLKLCLRDPRSLKTPFYLVTFHGTNIPKFGSWPMDYNGNFAVDNFGSLCISTHDVSTV